MAEEHLCQAPRLCANNCGFFGSPATKDLCSKCYHDLQLKEQQSSNVKLALNQTLAFSSSSSVTATSPSPVALSTTSPVPAAEETVAAEVAAAPLPQANRCSACRRRVGLTGFKCRCGMTFCASHRYAEQHGCGFDFKVLGREQISEANPIVKAEKLDKI